MSHRSGYNEILIDANAWRESPASTVETFFEVMGQSSGKARSMHAAFLRAHSIDAAAAPFVKLDARDWERPFR